MAALAGLKPVDVAELAVMASPARSLRVDRVRAIYGRHYYWRPSTSTHLFFCLDG
jgi:hypothetical protein